MSQLILNEEKHEYTLDGIVIPGVTQILEAEGLSDFSAVPVVQLQAAQQFGTAVHKACELWDKINLDMKTLDKALMPYLEAWDKFKKDFNVNLLLDWIERHEYSRLYNYGFTPDRVAKIGHRYTVIDIKSSATIKPADKIQIAGYQVGAEEILGERVDRWIIQLLDTGEYKRVICDKKTDRSIFISALNLYKWKQKNMGGKNGNK